MKNVTSEFLEHCLSSYSTLEWCNVMLATATRTHLLWWNIQFLSPLPPYIVVLFPFAAITVRHRVCVNFMGNMHTSRGACIHHVKRAYIMGNVHIWWQTRIHNGERAYMMADTHTSRWLCTHHGKYAYIMGNLYKSCQTRIHHGERAYIMANTHTSRGTCIHHWGKLITNKCVSS